MPHSRWLEDFAQTASTEDARDPQGRTMVDLVLLKWLLAHHGTVVNVDRMHSDRSYACENLQRAFRSTNSALRTTARRLAEVLQVDLPIDRSQPGGSAEPPAPAPAP